ncbi:hypothetical protein ACIODS_11840 [Micromonospora chalcea]|uniref:hypothetical protein n=1 Tax=Micromonospora chalcea TaxID=1874 RepID=UPI0038177BB3
MTDVEAEIRRDHETATTALRDLLADTMYDSPALARVPMEYCRAVADALLPLFAPSWEYGVRYTPADLDAVYVCDDQDHAREEKRDLNWEGPTVRRLRASLRPGAWTEQHQ